MEFLKKVEQNTKIFTPYKTILKKKKTHKSTT